MAAIQSSLKRPYTLNVDKKLFSKIEIEKPVFLTKKGLKGLN